MTVSNGEQEIYCLTRTSNYPQMVKEEAIIEKPREATTENVNKPLTHLELKELKPVWVPKLNRHGEPVKDKKTGEVIMVRGMVHETPHLNNRARRFEKQPLYRKGGNRKNTPGRHRQIVEVMSKKESKFGLLNVPTGLFRRIIHSGPEAAVNKFKYDLQNKVYEARKKLISADPDKLNEKAA
jgi:hypothetical protein